MRVVAGLVDDGMGCALTGVADKPMFLAKKR
jgi:hypothetical protein